MTGIVLVAQAAWLLVGWVLYQLVLACHGDSCGGPWWGSLLVISIWGIVEAVLAPATLVVLLIALANRLAGTGDGHDDF